MTFLPAAPVIIYLLGAVGALLAHPNKNVQRAISLMTNLFALATSLALLTANLNGQKPILRFGDWQMPYGIIYVADPLACLMLIATAAIGLATSIYIWSSLKNEDENLYFHFLTLVLLAGVSAAFLTGDLFHLFVCFELLLISSFVLMSLGSKASQIEASVKYVSINLISSVLFVMSIGVVYSQIGTLNLADITQKMPEAMKVNPWIQLSGFMMLISFGIKAGMFPLFFWLPSSYHTPPTAITALFAGLLTKVGVYSLMRVFPLLYFPINSQFEKIFLILGTLTMVIGVIGAVGQFQIKRILSIHIISQVGYIILAIGMKSQLAIAAAIYYTLHNMIAKTNLFFVSGLVEKIHGSDDLDHCGSLFKKMPYFSALFLISALGLAGIPPLSGFFAKWFVIYSAATKEEYFAVFVALAVSVLTLYSMLKIWNYGFWQMAKPDQEVHLNDFLANSQTKKQLWAGYFVTATFALGVVALGIFAEDVFDLCMKASHLIFNPQNYVDFVLGGHA